ncbi:membrane protein [Bacteroidia bacterium]|nr:membrane protein [Bacteroidia bacterium]GHT60752.1 membrane protein [Bacteroidia bacterium]
MKFFNKIFIAAALVSFTLLTACSDDYLDTKPTNAVSEVTIGESLDNIYMAINGIHRKMVSQDRENQGMGSEPGFRIGFEAMGDDLTWDTQTWHQGFLNWSFVNNPSSSYNFNLWRTYYEFIMNANKILELLDKNFAESSNPTAKYIRGEALAIRAWCHFQLVQLYAKPYRAGQTNGQDGVIIRDNTGMENKVRATVEEVYTMINTDLDESATLLAGYKAKDVTHYSEKVVWGLKARVALAQQNYTKAGEYAAKSIQVAESEGLKMMDKSQLIDVFPDITTKTKDAMYASRTQDDQTVYFYSFYAYMSWNFNSTSIRTGIKCINQATYDLMSQTDLRRQWWDPTGTASVPATSYNQRKYQNRKFTARSTANAVGDFAYMRLTEIYLTAAEAYARAGNPTEAKKYFLPFVAQRDPDYTDLGNTGAALAEEIMIHRRIELWGEGFRLFDIKRLGLPINRNGSNYTQTFCGFLQKQPSDNVWEFEIPKAETDFNDLCKTNY